MEVIVLAVTEAFGRYCVAGKTLDGRWIRPIPQQPFFQREEDRFWYRKQITFDEQFLQVGDKIFIEGTKPQQLFNHNHSEDLITTSIEKRGHLNAEELINFLDVHTDNLNNFINTVSADKGRSLCVIEVKDFTPLVNYYEGKQRITIKFTHNKFNLENPRTKNGDYIVKDCRWKELIANNDVPDIQHNRLFFCVGLATPYNGIEYPMAIGIITDYELPIIINN